MDAAALPRQAVVQTGARLTEIEFLRAVAVLMVLAGHAALMLVFWPSHIAAAIRGSGLQTGVDLFFAISGFVIARSLLPRLAGITDRAGFMRVATDFWIARAWRLLPSSWLWLALPLPLCVVFNHSGAFGSLPANAAMLIAGLLDLANFHLAGHYGQAVGIAFPQWSLSLEEQFYLALPFAAFFLKRWLVPVLAVIALLGFLLPDTPLVLCIRLWPVAFGVLLALWARHATYLQCAPTGLAKSRAARAMVLVVGIASLISLGAPGLHVVSFDQGMVALVSAGLVWLASYDAHFLVRPGLLRDGAMIISARSYSLYLIHIPIYCTIRELWWRRHGTALPSEIQRLEIALAAVLLLVAVTELNHRLLEKPLRAHGKRIVAARRARRVTPA